MLCHAGKGAGQQAGAAGYIQHCVFWASASPLHNSIQHFLVAYGRSGGEGRSLARELIKNAGVVRTHARKILNLKPKI
jgi:hypothetical protein